MLQENRLPHHPGEILREEFLAPLGATLVDFAEHVGVPLQRVNEIVCGMRGVSPETAWPFSAAFGTTPELWINLQTAHDLAASKPTRSILSTSTNGLTNPLGSGCTSKLTHEAAHGIHVLNFGVDSDPRPVRRDRVGPE